MREIDKSVKVVGNKQAIDICSNLGFTNTVVLDHGESVKIGSITVTAFPGSLVGPPWAKRQNGYIFSSNRGKDNLLYEPHGDTDNKLAKLAVDYNITEAILPMTT